MVSEELGGADAVLVDCISDPPENIVQIRRLMLLIGSICYSIEVYIYLPIHSELHCTKKCDCNCFITIYISYYSLQSI